VESLWFLQSAIDEQELTESRTKDYCNCLYFIIKENLNISLENCRM